MTYGPTSEQKLNTTYFISRDSVCVLILEALPGIETVSDIFFADKFTKKLVYILYILNTFTAGSKKFKVCLKIIGTLCKILA